MRVGLIAPTWLPIPAPAYGGTETVVDTLARGLLGGLRGRLFSGLRLACKPALDSLCDWRCDAWVGLSEILR